MSLLEAWEAVFPVDDGAFVEVAASGDDLALVAPTDVAPTDVAAVVPYSLPASFLLPST